MSASLLDPDDSPAPDLEPPPPRRRQSGDPLLVPVSRERIAAFLAEPIPKPGPRRVREAVRR